VHGGVVVPIRAERATLAQCSCAKRVRMAFDEWRYVYRWDNTIKFVQDSSCARRSSPKTTRAGQRASLRVGLRCRRLCCAAPRSSSCSARLLLRLILQSGMKHENENHRRCVNWFANEEPSLAPNQTNCWHSSSFLLSIVPSSICFILSFHSPPPTMSHKLGHSLLLDTVEHLLNQFVERLLVDWCLISHYTAQRVNQQRSILLFLFVLLFFFLF
jgi:hypothetical protein